MSLTGNQLLTGLSKFVDDYFTSTTTSAGNSTFTTIVDTKLEVHGDNALVGQYIRITEGTYINQVGRITANVQATGTVTVSPPFGGQIASGTDYELHKYEPRVKFIALDSARIPAVDYAFRSVYDETITTDGKSREFAIPSTIHRGPAAVYIEAPTVGTLASWNFIPEPDFTDTMANWTFSNATATSISQATSDYIIPKSGSAATRIAVAASTTGTATLPVANMDNDVTAALAAGRRVTLALEIYSLTAARVTLRALDDSATVTESSAHQGRGWELLHVTADIAPNNATILSARINIATGALAVVIFVNKGWMYYGDYGVLNSNFYDNTPVKIRRDSTNQRFTTVDVLPPRRQLRLVGKEILTALGTDTTAQTTNTMELDETSAELLYAEAAEVLFQGQRLTTENLPQVLERIKVARDRMKKMKQQWSYEMEGQRIIGPYSR